MRSVHIAMDKFRGCFTQEEITELLRSIVAPHFSSIRTYPMADGGEGSLDFFRVLQWREISIKAMGPDATARASFLMQSPDCSTIAIELAEIAGQKHASEALTGWQATSEGLGLALLQAASHKPSTILICLGGSASSDGGLGVFSGLGIQVVDRTCRQVPRGLSGLVKAESVNPESLSATRKLFSGIEIRVLVDTRAQLVGKTNSISMYGKQKGLGFTQRLIATHYFKKWAKLLQSLNPMCDPRAPGMGAAGGCGAALYSIFDTSLVSGSEFFCDLSGISNEIDSNSLVMTGEGLVDSSTLTGKTIMPVIHSAVREKSQLVIIAGSIKPSVKKEIQSLAPSALFFEILQFASNKEQAITRASEILRKNLLKELELLP